jgi:outer membrane protein assembly factor BamB
MDNHNSPSSGFTSALKRMRWWIPLGIVVLAIGFLTRLHFATELDSNFKAMQTSLTFAVTVLLLILWFVIFTRLRWRIRLAGLLLLGLLGFGLNRLVRFDGAVDGTGKPQMVWNWKPKKTGNVGALKFIASGAGSNSVPSEAEESGYLGTNRNGVVEGLKLDRNWSAHPPQQLWRQPIGLGWSSFCIAGARAFTQEQRGEDELVVCYQLTTGHVLWAHTNHARFSESLSGDGPRATPTLFGGRIYAFGGTGILDCLDAGTGQLLWSHDVLKENSLPNLPFGKSTSPLIYDELVVVSGGMTNSSTLLAYHLKDGSPAWRGGTDKASFSSPVLTTLAGKRQIVSVNASSASGHDPVTGAVLWEYVWPGEWPKCTQPIILPPERIFLSASFNAGCMLLQVNAAPDGKLSVTEKWKNRNMKSEFSNIVTRDGFAYGLDDGILACIDLATGERKWKDGRYGHGQVLLINDLLLVQTENGPLALVEANPACYREVANLKALNSKTWNVPAVGDGCLLVRNDLEVACYKLPLLQP